MFDIFNKKKVERLESDIKTLYTLYESLERSEKNNRIFDSFRSNKFSYHLRPLHNGQIVEQVEPKFEDITIKTVIEMILDKMGLWVKYKPAKKEVINETPSEFTLRSVNRL